MDYKFCPGAKLLRQPAPEIFICPSCGEEVEIWTDEIKARCPNCKRTVFRNESMSCLDWCKYGKECVGNDIYEKHMKNRKGDIRQKLLEKLEEHFGKDKKRIDHAKEVLCFAEKLLKAEKADWHIVIPASILHDVGIKAAEEKYGSCEAHYQEQEGPPIARNILLPLGLKLEEIDQICEIIAHHHSPGRVNTKNFKVVYDADLLVNIRETACGKKQKQLQKIIERSFLTRGGKQLAIETYME